MVSSCRWPDLASDMNFLSLSHQDVLRFITRNSDRKNWPKLAPLCVNNVDAPGFVV